MVNNRKVRLMTKLAMYETGEGREDLKLNRYFRRDYLRSRMLNSFVATTVGYCFLVGLAVLYEMDYFVSNAVVIDYMMLLKRVIAVYIVLLAVSVMSSLVFGMIHYNRSRNKLAKYFRMLRRLRSYYNSERNASAGMEGNNHVN